MFVGQRLKALRKEKDLSQQALGDALGITKVSICGYENGTRIPSLETFVMLADFFGVTTDYFLGREVSVIHEGEGEYVGSISQDDIKIQKELRKYTTARYSGWSFRCCVHLRCGHMLPARIRPIRIWHSRGFL